MRQLAFWSLALFIFVVPWQDAVNFGDQLGGIARVAGVLAFVIGVLAVLFNGAIRHPRTEHILCLVVLLYSFLTILWTVDVEQSTYMARTNLQVMWSVWLIWEFADSIKHINQLLWTYIISGFVVSCQTILDFIHTGVPFGAKQFRYSIDEGVNPNGLALGLAMGVPFAIYMGVRQRRLHIRLFALSYVFVALFAIALTASRSAFVVALVGICFLPLFSAQENLSKKAVAICGITGGLLAGCAWIPDVATSRLSTILSQLQSGDLNGRVAVWVASWNIIQDHPFLGIGIGNFDQAVGLGMSAHNTYVSILTEQGTIGLAIFSVLLLALFLSMWKMPRGPKLLWFGVLVCWCIGVTTIDWNSNRITWIVFGLLLTHSAVLAEQVERARHSILAHATHHRYEPSTDGIRVPDRVPVTATAPGL